MESDHTSSTHQPCHEHFRHVPIPTYIWETRDQAFLLEDFNNAALNFSGPKLKNLLGKTAEEVYHDRPDIIALMQECRESKAPVEKIIDLHLRTTGELKTLQCSWIWISPSNLLFCVHDITEVVQAEQILQEKIKLRTDELSGALNEIKNKEHFLTQVFDSIQEGICVLSPDMDILKINKKMRSWYDYQPRFEGEKCYQVFQGQRDSLCEFCPAHKTIHDKVPNMSEVQAFHPDNDAPLWFEVHTFPLLNEQNALTGIIEFVRNITERKQLEIQLKKSELMFRSIVENIPCLVYSFSPEKGAIYNSPSAKKVLGHSVDDLMNNPMLWHDSIHPDDLPAVDQAIEALSPEQNDQLEYRIRNKNGDTHWFLDRFAMHKTDNGGQEIHGIAIDITEKKENEHKIQFLSSITQNLADSIMVTDHNFYIEYINPAAQELFGYSLNELKGKTPDLFNAEEDTALQARIYDQISKGETVLAEALNRKKDGTLFHCQFKVMPLKNDKNEITNYIGIQRDITEEVAAEEALIASEDRYRMLSGVTFEGILLHDHGITIDVNDKFLELSGFARDELIGHNLFDLVIPEDQHELIKANIQQQKTLPYETVLITKERQRIPVEVEARRTRYQDKDVRVTAIRDIRERKKAEEQRHELEEQLRQKYKMEAVGVMAGGIAHNFNNNLSIILGNVELSQFKLPRNTEVNNYLNNAKKAIFNSRDLVSQILSYSRKGAQNKNLVGLALLTDETLNMLRSTIPSSVNLEQIFSQESRDLKIYADATQIQESIINLCNNAVHAMDEKGHLKIILDAVDLKRQDIPSTSNCQSGFFAKLSVQDDGCGMDSETLGKIFDPFFTTKAVNEGTGMGLSSVHGIVEQHGGFIRVNSIPGKGSVFDLYIPAKQQATKQIDIEDGEMQSGTGRILFVDDEPMLAELAGQMLTELGYDVTTETDSRAALKRMTESNTPFDLLVTDQTMPHLTGKELIEKVRRIHPEMPVILCTGYSSKINEHEAKNMGINSFCLKPLDYHELSRRIKGALN